jgi:hypothetical protein
MASLGELAAHLKLDGVPAMQSGLAGVGRACGSLKSAIGTIAGPLALLGVSFEAFRSLQGITEGLKGVFEAGLELRTLSRTTGQSVGDLRTLQMAFKETGVSADALPSALRLMQSALGGVNEDGQPTATVFNRLHLSIQQLRGETAVQQLQAIGGALHKLGNQTLEVAAAREIFGRAGAELLPVLNDQEAMESLGKGIAGQAAIFQRSAETFSRISLDLESLGHKVRGLFVGMADQIAPVLLPLLDKLKSIDLTPLGEQLGGIVRIVANAFKGGRIGELVGASLQVGAMEGVNVLWDGLRAAAGGFSALFMASLRAAARIFSELTKSQNWAGITHALLSAGLALGGSFIKAGAYLQASMDYAVQGSVYAWKSGMLDGLRDWDSQWGTAMLDPVTLLIKVLATAAKGFGKAMYEAIHGNLSGVKKAARGLDSALLVADPVAEMLSLFNKTMATARAANGAAPNFGALLNARLAQSSGQSGDLDKASRSELALAGSDLAPMAERVMADLKTELTKISKAVKDGLGGDPLFNVGAELKHLEDLAAQLAAIGDPTKLPGAPGAAGSPFSGLGGATKMDNGDRLARIGGFIGGGGGPALDLNRRTAVATEKGAVYLATLVQRWAGAGGHPANTQYPAWGA